MPIKTECKCGAAFAAPDKFAGKKVKCPKCAEPVVVRAPSTVAAKCQCGKVVKAPRKLAGKTVKCPACGTGIQIPGGPPAAAKSDDGIGDLFDEVNLLASKTGHRCPECRTDLAAEDVVCVNCGFHLETGKKLTTKTVSATSRDPVAAAVAASQAGFKQKSADDAPPAVVSLAKLLNQVGMLAVLGAIGFVGLKCYQAMQGSAAFDTNQISQVMSGSAGFVLGGAVVLLAVPCAVAAKLVSEGKAAGRVLSMAMAGIGLLGLVTTVPAIFALKLAMSDEVARYCR